MMMPGADYTFPGDYVTEIPQMGKGGLTQWFAEEWTDVKTGKPCGRSGKEKGSRPYPACRPKKRVNETTPKTTSEMSSAEKAKFKREKTSGKRIDYNHKRREDGGETWLDQYQDGGIKNKRKNISDSPNYQYDDKGNLLYTPSVRIEPYAADNSTRGSFSVNPKLVMQNLNPTLEEFINVASPYYPIDNKLVIDPKINLQPSKYQQYLEQEYVLPQMVGRSFGNLPLIKDDGYSPNRRWVSNLRAKDTGSKYSNDSYAYVLKTNPNNLVDYSTKNTIEDSVSSNDKVFYDYLAKNNYLPNTVSQLTKKLPDQIWNTAEQMRVEMLNNPEIMSWANLHNIDLGYKQKGQGDDSFAPKIPESVYANRLVKAGLATNRPDYDYKPMETYIVQDPSKFNLAGYFPMNSIVKDAEQKVLNKKVSDEPKQESIYFGTPEYFEKESYIKNEIAKRLGINPSAFDTGEYLIHYNQSPITEYTPGKKYGGWLEQYQEGGFRYTSPPRRAFTTSYQQPTRSTSDNTRVVTPNVSDATRAMVADQRAREAAAKRSGVIYAGTPESDYEKAKRAASFVEQSIEKDGFATPLDYVLDFVNPATYAFAATDLVGNTSSAVSNAAQGNFKEAGSDLTNAAFNALTVAPIVPGVRAALPSVAKYATTQTPLKNTHKYNPWKFKGDPEAYYHRSPNLENITNKETGMLQGFGESEAGKLFSEAAAINPGIGINLKKPANSRLYFSKGTPLDYGRTNKVIDPKTGKLIPGQGYPGPYIVEVKGVPMGVSTKGRAPGAEPTQIGSYAVPKVPIPLDQAKFYKEDWLRGYKPIQGPFTMQEGGEQPNPEDIERMEAININTKKSPWYERLYRKAADKIGLDPYNRTPDDFFEQWARKISDSTGGSEWYKQSNPFMNFALESINAPQYAATYAVTGKVQTPSEAMDIQNPYGAFAVDALLDPMNVVGVGVSSKARNLFSQVPDQLNSSIARQINKNPRLALSLQRGRPINTSNVSIISGINPGDVSAFPDMVKRINPNTVSESTFFKQLEKGSTSLDSSLQKRISDLESKEGFKRLVDQEKDYLFYNSDLPEDTIERVAKINARSRIDELKNITNVNKEASEYASANFLNAGLPNPFTENNYLYNNAFYKSGADDVISDIVSKSKGINLVKPTPNYSKSVPGEIGIGYNYVGNKPIEMHEIGHVLQRGRKLSIDDQLKNITPKKQLSADQQRVYNYFTKGSGGMEPSAFANELRESMLQKGFIPDYYSPISQQQVQDAYTYFKKNPIGTYDKNTGKFLSTTRIFDFMDATKSNSKLLSDILNKLPAVAPIGIGAAGVAQLPEQKYGGWLNKYK